MGLQVFGKNIEITPIIQNYVDKKIKRLNRYLLEIEEVKVEIIKENTRSPQSRYKVQITIRSRGKLLRSEEKSSNVNLGVDAAVDALARQISRFKNKLGNKRGKQEMGQQKIDTSLVGKCKNTLPKVVKTKRFSIKLMTIEEAAEQMELLNHDFFLFLNSDTNLVSLLYRRKDGDYGLIETNISYD